MTARPRRSSTAASADPYQIGLRLLARRELSSAQLRVRLRRRELPEEQIDAAVARLQQQGALDDWRTALALARTATRVKRRGRLRVLREIEAAGIGRDLARAAVTQVFGELDEAALLQQALERRLRGRRVDRSTLRRTYAALLRQGFPASSVLAALKARVKQLPDDLE